MKKINAGVKIFSIKDKAFLDRVAENADFIETMAIRGENYDFLESYNKRIVIHAEHQGFGVNPADPDKHEQNLASISFALKLADRLDAKKIICHAGSIVNEGCNEEASISFFKEIKDKRILLENLRLLGSPKKPAIQICFTPEEMMKFQKVANKGFCLDFTHAILSAVILGKKDCNEFINAFLKMNPRHFHFSDIKFIKLKDHLNFGDGDLDIEFYKKILPDNSDVTLETTLDADKVLNDLKIMKA